MNIKIRITAIAGTLAVLFALATGCGTARGAKEALDKGPGFGLTIVAPQGKNLGPDEGYLPDLVMGVISADFTNYSDIKVRDWASYSKVQAEMERLIYEETGDSIQAGKIAQSEYILSGELSKSNAGDYSLRLTVSDTAAGNKRAEYTGNCALADLVNNTAIRQASAELLTQMGVRLSDSDRAKLGLINEQDAQARQAMAKGAAAQRSGTVVDAMSYYFQASELDFSLMDSWERLSVLADAEIAQGNIGQSARNEIEQRNAWIQLLEKCEQFFKGVSPWELVYDPTITTKRTNYETESADLAFKARLEEADSVFALIRSVEAGLAKTGKAESWGLSKWRMPVLEDSWWSFRAQLLNENEKIIGTLKGEFKVRMQEYDAWKAQKEKDPMVLKALDWAYPLEIECVFKDVKAGDITDKLTVQIDRVERETRESFLEEGFERRIRKIRIFPASLAD